MDKDRNRGLSLDGIGFAYGDRRVLDGVTLDLAPGELVGVLGLNGSGKTTLLRCASGFLRPTEGRVTLDGRPVRAYAKRELARHLAFVPQRANLAFDFSVQDAVLMGRNPYLKMLQREGEKDVQIARAAMERTGTLELGKRSILTLSGGEWQRVVIARAICQQAGVLLLDEPVTGLDVRYQLEIMRLVRDLCLEAGVAALVVLHDVNLAAHYCDRLLLLKSGRTEALAAPEEVLTESRIRAVFAVDAKVERVQGRPFMIQTY